MITITKRNGGNVEFDKSKIENAILKAMKYGSGIVDTKVASQIANEIEAEITYFGNTTINYVETRVYCKLIEHDQMFTAKSYEGYRKTQEYQRLHNSIDESVEGIVNGTNVEVIDENSNKNAIIHSTQRDLIAGEYSKDYSRRKKLPVNIIANHDAGTIHFHDLDYYIEHIFNCCLVNLKDMLMNGTVINNKMIDRPKSLYTACTIATQVVQQVANGQYGGQTISISHLAPFVRVSYEKNLKKIRQRLIRRTYKKNYSRYIKKYVEQFGEQNRPMIESMVKDLLMTEIEVLVKSEAKARLKEEITSAVQTIQYQINTFSTCNGQAPFLTLFMYLNEEPEYVEETAMLIEEVLKQRYQGMKNKTGVWVTPSFPKLIYVLDENNVPANSEYRYLTDLAVKTVTKRMMPDFISAKVMRETYDGEVFPCMGCRSFLSPWKDADGKYKWYGRFNQGVVTINLADVGLSAEGLESRFWNILDERLELCKDGLILRHENLENTSTGISPIHWQYGAIARLPENSNFNELLHNGYSTLSLGYIGLYECVLAMLGESHTSKKGEKFALEIMNHIKSKVNEWTDETGLGFGLYGTPAESTTYKFAKCLKKRFGVIEGITDKDYLINSYHVDVKEPIDAYDKLEFESQFQKISTGGAISYVEIANMCKNEEAVSDLVNYMYETIQYAEINTKSDYCQECGFDGEILLDDNNEWYCPNCGNRDRSTMNVTRRTCGYLGDNFWNAGKTDEIKHRVVHMDNQILDDTELD